MISLGQPLLLGDRLRRSRHEAYLHRQRRNSLPNKAVLIAADEGIAQRLGIGLHLYSLLLRDLAHRVPKVGLIQPVNGQHLQRKNRQEHVGIDVGDD